VVVFIIVLSVPAQQSDFEAAGAASKHTR
jgi:hypothetical protein